MYLKSLTLKGFKSFAQPTTFAFEPGVTAVVGPNGSGKSNVVDALAWVMGEQGAKTLRGGKMEDVIFAGTSTKGPLGRAEVTLTIDNSDGALPIEYSEVTISRTLFRNGGSEYAINGEGCRLLDVQELLSDSGLGREMHVIVGQGQLDNVLKATPEERRGFIEEAAGILKHRRRKEKTQRKLEAMQINLTRLSDLAAEVRRQLKPLGQQAEVARQAQGIASVVRDAKSRILAAEIVELQNAVDESSRNENERRAERTLLQTMLQEQQLRLTELEAALVSSKVDAARTLAHQFESVGERMRSLQSIAIQRVSLLQSQSVQNSSLGDPAVLQNQVTEAEAAVERLTATAHELQERLKAAELSRNEARDVLEAFDSEAAEQNSLVSKFDLELARLANDAVNAESRLLQIQAEASRQSEAVVEAAERHLASQRDFEQLEKQLQSGAVSDASAAEQTYEAAQRAVADSQAAIDSIREQLHAAERSRDSLAAKRSALNLTLDQKDGASQLGAAGLKGIRGLVANHIRIQPGFEAAIAAALGTLADAMVAENLDSAVAAIGHLKEVDGGRVDLIIADLEAAGKASATFNIDGATAAVSVVSAPAGVLSLLANVFIVADLSAAKRVLLEAESDVVVITKDGDLLDRSILRGGSSRKPSKVELVAERDAAELELNGLGAKIEDLRGDLAQARATNESATDSAKAALAALKQHDAQLAANAEQLGRLRVQSEAAAAELARLTESAELARSGIEAAETALAAAVSAHDEFAKRERPVLDLSQRQTLAANLEQARQTELEIRVDLGAANERLRVERESVVLLGKRLAETLDELERNKAAQIAQSRRLAAASRVLEVLPEVLELVAERVGSTRATLHELEAQRSSQNADLVKLRGETAELQMRLATLTQSVHDIELTAHERRLNLANLTTRAYDELGLEHAVLISEYGPDQPIPNPEVEGETISFVAEQQQRRLRDAERLLERLGKVNPLALEEFAALEQRHKFLTEQLADLTQTRKDLLQIIEELDQKMQSIFADAFDDTKAAFEKVFPVLFPGGSGSIFLTNPDDLLTTGIEVNIKPAGKRIDRLSLLSGGERSLAAVALLIAIFKARPSPFYVMDEVEAALDDANLGRLLQIFQDLRTNSQLIIITHQKRTMEIADALYGVSMRQDGISAVVGQRVVEGS